MGGSYKIRLGRRCHYWAGAFVICGCALQGIEKKRYIWNNPWRQLGIVFNCLGIEKRLD